MPGFNGLRLLCHVLAEPHQNCRDLRAGGGAEGHDLFVIALNQSGVDRPAQRGQGIFGDAVIIGKFPDGHAALRGVVAFVLRVAVQNGR